jgi:hypothetical protein
MVTPNNNRAPVEVPGSWDGPLGWLRDTFSFFVYPGWKGFFRARQGQHGDVFKCHAIMKTIAVLDVEAFEPFVKWDGRLAKKFGFGWAKPPLPLLGGKTLSVFSDGEAHDGPKLFYRKLFDLRAGSLVKAFAGVS